MIESILKNAFFFLKILPLLGSKDILKFELFFVICDKFS